MNALTPQPPSPYTAPPKPHAAETHTLRRTGRQRGRACWRASSGCFRGAATTSPALTVAEVAHTDRLSRITIVTSGTPEEIEQVTLQLDRLVPVHSITDLTLRGECIERELAMIKGRGPRRGSPGGAAPRRGLPRPRHRRFDRELRVPR